MSRRYRKSHIEELLTIHAILERLEECQIERWIKPNQQWRYQSAYSKPDLRPAELSTSYGDWDEIKSTDELTPDTFVMVPYCSGSDYGNSCLVEVSNMKSMVETLDGVGLEGGTDYITYCGGYGSFALAIRVYSLIEIEPSEADSIIETIEALEDYPLIDESKHSELEIESQNEAWDSWARHDFERELTKYIAAWHAESQPLLAAFADDEDWIPEGKVSDWFYRLSELANENWINESGSDSYIDVEDVVKNGFGRELRGEWGHKERRALAREIKLALVEAYATANGLLAC